MDSLEAVVTGAGQTSPHVAGDDEAATGADPVGVLDETLDGIDDGEEVVVGVAEQATVSRVAIATRTSLTTARIAPSGVGRKGQRPPEAGS